MKKLNDLKDLEKKFTDQKFVDEKVKEYYGASSVGNKDAENNTFWYVMEEMERKYIITDIEYGTDDKTKQKE